MSDPLTTATPPHTRRTLRVVVGVILALGLPCGVLGAMMLRHPEDGFERLPGLLERPEYVERHGRLTSKHYERPGWGENGHDSFTVLKLDGEPIPMKGGHLGTAGMCVACDGVQTPETALVYRFHRESALRGWFAVQVHGDELVWTLLCEDTDGPITWIGTRLSLPCGVVFDATAGKVEPGESTP